MVGLRIFLATVLTFAVSNFAFALEPCTELEQSRPEDGGASLFGKKASYQGVYDIITYYPQYQAALNYHMRAVGTIPRNGIVIDAGGGTGIMTRNAMNLRPDARVYLNDYNEAMARHALAKGISSEQLSLGPDRGDIQRLHLGNRRANNGEVDAIFSHSVLWNLTDPSIFIKEASRVLKKGGILSVSTFRPGVKDLVPYFVKSIQDGFEPAVRRGIVPKQDAETFVQQNAIATANIGSPGSPLKSSLSENDIRKLAADHGFEVVDISDCYVVATPNGPKPFFIQFQLRKK